MRCASPLKVLLLASSGVFLWTGCGVETGGSSLEEANAGDDAVVSLRTSLDSARVLYDEGKYDSARAVWFGTLERARTLKDSTAETEALTWLGLASWQVQVFDRALNAAEIRAEYDAGSAGKCKS